RWFWPCLYCFILRPVSYRLRKELTQGFLVGQLGRWPFARSTHRSLHAERNEHAQAGRKVRFRGQMPRLPGRASLAEWRPVPALQVEEHFADQGAQPVRLQRLPLPVLRDGWDDHARLAPGPLEVVHGDLPHGRV